MSNTYLYEKWVATRHAEVRRDMHLRRKPSYIEQSSTFVEHTASKLGTLLVEPGTRLHQAEQRQS